MSNKDPKILKYSEIIEEQTANAMFGLANNLNNSLTILGPELMVDVYKNVIASVIGHCVIMRMNDLCGDEKVTEEEGNKVFNKFVSSVQESVCAGLKEGKLHWDGELIDFWVAIKRQNNPSLTIHEKKAVN